MKRLLSFLSVLAFVAPVGWAWQPGTSQPQAAGGFQVDRSDRTDVLAFFHTVYSASEGAAGRMGWTGNVTTGNAGATSSAFQEDVRRRVNFFRALAGLPADVVFDPVKAAKCQQAALMFAENKALSHQPPKNWNFRTEAAAEAAFASNIHLGRFGPEAIDDYIVDPGENNAPVGHRRWIFYPEAVVMATGDVPPTPGKWSANALWVVGDFGPVQPVKFVPWPAAGYVPAPLVPARWSLSYRGANFAQAVVTMKRGATTVPVQVISRTLDPAKEGFGDNTIVWEPQGLITNSELDVVYDVTVSGIAGDGVPTEYSYSVRVFDPDVLGHATSITGPNQVALTGSDFSFAPVPQGDAYELRVSRVANADWVEGAEGSGGVIDGTAAAYALRQAAVKRTGNRAFQLTISNLANPEQAFELGRELVPSAQTRIVFHDLFRWVHAESRLSLEVSANGGMSWTEVWGRNGNIATERATSADWETAFARRDVGLGAYAGRPIKLRFVLRAGSYAFFGTPAAYYGAFIDDISVTNAVELVQTNASRLPDGATTFSVNAATAGSSWTPGAKFAVRVKPQVGTQWFEGPLRMIEVAPTAEQQAADYWMGQGQMMNLALPSEIVRLSGIPPGLRFHATTKVLSGRPTRPGVYPVVATLASGGVRNYVFVVEGVPAWSVGTFEALLPPSVTPGNALTDLGGHLTITVATSGSFTGTLRLGTKRIPVRGQFEPLAETLRGSNPISAQIAFLLNRRDPASEMEVLLDLLPEDAGDQPGLSATVEIGGFRLESAAGWQRSWNARTKPAFGGKPRLINLSFENKGSAGPGGQGYASARAAVSGVVTWAGVSADGLRWTASHGTTPGGELPLYASPGGSPRAVLFGLAGTSESPLLRVDIETEPAFRWVKRGTPANIADRLYRSGFDVPVDVRGAEHVPPAKGQVLFGNPIKGSFAEFELFGEHLSTAPPLAGFHLAGRVAIPCNWLAPGFSLATSGLRSNVSFSSGTGGFAGSIIIPGTVPRTLTFRGIYVPDLDDPAKSRIVGFHLLADLPDPGASAAVTPIRSGKFLITVP